VTNPLYLPQDLVWGMLEHARGTLPHECVGLLFGKGDEARRQVELPNTATEPGRRFEAEPEALLAALQGADRLGDELVAVYHSHPNGTQTPSETDLQEARYAVPHLIIVPQESILRGFRLSKDTFHEVDLIVTSTNA
jgi:proteasome lid subunit RPN8/RPN11